MPPKKPAAKSSKMIPKSMKQVQDSMNSRERKAYDSLFKLIDDRKWEEIMDISKELLKTYPTHFDVQAFQAFAIYYIHSSKINLFENLFNQSEQELLKFDKLVAQQTLARRLIKQAADSVKDESHLPHQLFCSILRSQNQFKEAEQQMRIILSMSAWQTNGQFNRDLAFFLYMQGQYGPSFEQYKKAIQFQKSEYKEDVVNASIMLGMLASKKQEKMLVSDVKSYVENEIKKLQLQFHVHTVQNKSTDYVPNLANISQLRYFCNFMIWKFSGAQEGLLDLQTNEDQILDPERQLKLKVLYKMELQHNIDDDLALLIQRNPDDLEYYKLKIVYLLGQQNIQSNVTHVLDWPFIGSHQKEYLELYSSFKTWLDQVSPKMLSLQKSQILCKISYLQNEECINSLFEQYNKLNNAACFELFLKYSDVMFEQIKDKLIQFSSGKTTLFAKAIQVKYQNHKYSDMEISHYLSLNGVQCQLNEQMQNYVLILDEWEKQKERINITAADDELVLMSKMSKEEKTEYEKSKKPTLPLPEQPDIPDNDFYVTHSQIMFQQGILLSTLVDSQSSVQILKLLTLLDPRDRYLNVLFAQSLLHVGDVANSLKAHQRFIAKYNVIIQIGENQEQILQQLIGYQDKPFSTLFEDESPSVLNTIPTQLNFLLNLINVSSEHINDQSDLLGIALQQKYDYANFAQICWEQKSLICKQPWLHKVITKLIQILESVKLWDEEQKKQFVSVYYNKFQKLFVECFKKQCKYDGEYERSQEPDPFGLKAIQQIINNGKWKVDPKIVILFRAITEVTGQKFISDVLDY